MTSSPEEILYPERSLPLDRILDALECSLAKSEIQLLCLTFIKDRPPGMAYYAVKPNAAGDTIPLDLELANALHALHRKSCSHSRTKTEGEEATGTITFCLFCRSVLASKSSDTK